MFEVRDDEPGYAKLYDPTKDVSDTADYNKDSQENNRYGQRIQLVAEEEAPVSLNINHEDAVGSNPNRGKQHGFHFTADNCIGCHACESACSEKNDLPAHLAFRSVGYVEGGTFPNHHRMNISMACNHCDDPVCLKGCPTRAYTKHPEYGAVIQDPDICFGCGYCTWVCPYNAPQLDPVAGQVEKCNMCVDRLEVGLKPACVSACVGNALDFGVIEDMPENRDAIDAAIPGFPDPEISHPNIRFQQNQKLPEELTRTDSTPLKYEKDEHGNYQPTLDEKDGLDAHWNFAKLWSSENPLVLFTLSTQLAVGLFSLLQLGAWAGIESFVAAKSSMAYLPAVVICLGLTVFGLLMSVTHLGKPFRFYRGYNNWRHSPVCREGLGITFFMLFMGIHLVCLLPAEILKYESVLSSQSTLLASLLTWLNPILVFAATVGAYLSEASAFLAMVAGFIGIYYMIKCYRIPARPFWNHISTNTHFVGNAIALGSLSIALLFSVSFYFEGSDWQGLLTSAAMFVFLGTVLEIYGLQKQAKDLQQAKHEGAASHYIQRTTFGLTYSLRNSFLLVNALLALLIGLNVLATPLSLIALAVLILSIAFTAFVGRAMFYVLVIPTTLPGAFFWKNKAFEQHARDIGMDHMPNTGVVPARH